MSSGKPNKPQQELSEQEIETLLNQVAANDHKACVAFFNYFRPRIAMQVRKKVFADEYTIDGIVNAILYEAIKQIPSYRREGGFGAFLSGIARNHCNNHIRSRYRGIQAADLDEDLLSSIPDETPGPEAQLIQKQDHEAVHYCLDKLTPNHREILRASYFGDLSEAECAEVFKIRQGTVKSRIFHAKEKLLACVKNWLTGGRHG